MPARALNLFIDGDEGRFVAGFTSTQQATLPAFVFGDVVPITARLLTDSTGGAVWKEQDLTGQNIRVAIGNPAGAPTAGTFKLAFDGDETAALSYAATEAQVQTALNALASVTSAGGVTVTKSSGGIFRVIFTTAGEQVAITVDAASLYPTIDAQSLIALAGDVETRQVVLIRLETQPAAYVELTDDLPEAGSIVTVLRVGATGIGEIQSLALDPEPYGGTFALTISAHATPAIAYNATASELQSAIEAADVSFEDMVTVTGSFPLWTIEFDASLSAVGAMTANIAGLIVPIGRQGSLGLNTAGIVELLNGAETATAKLEVEIYDFADSSSWTAAQADVTVKEDVIGNAPGSQTPLPVYITSEALAAVVDGKANLEGGNGFDGPQTFDNGEIVVASGASFEIQAGATLTLGGDAVISGDIQIDSPINDESIRTLTNNSSWEYTGGSAAIHLAALGFTLVTDGTLGSCLQLTVGATVIKIPYFT